MSAPNEPASIDSISAQAAKQRSAIASATPTLSPRCGSFLPPPRQPLRPAHSLPGDIAHGRLHRSPPPATHLPSVHTPHSNPAATPATPLSPSCTAVESDSPYPHHHVPTRLSSQPRIPGITAHHSQPPVAATLHTPVHRQFPLAVPATDRDIRYLQLHLRTSRLFHPYVRPAARTPRAGVPTHPPPEPRPPRSRHRPLHAGSPWLPPTPHQRTPVTSPAARFPSRRNRLPPPPLRTDTTPRCRCHPIRDGPL
jgi:hypothetical protein